MQEASSKEIHSILVDAHPRLLLALNKEIYRDIDH